MKLKVNDIDVFYPEKTPTDLERDVLNTTFQGHGLLECPLSEDRMTCLFSAVTSLMISPKNTVKTAIFCVSNIGRIQTAIKNLRRVTKYIESATSKIPPILGLPIAPIEFMSPKTPLVTSCKLCNEAKDFSTDVLMNGSAESAYKLPHGIYSFEKLSEAARGYHEICPYHLVRQNISQANIVVCTHKMLLDPKLRNHTFSKIPADSLVVFDEAHNIDKLCTEVMSIYVNPLIVKEANGLVDELKREVERFSIEENLERLKKEREMLTYGPAKDKDHWEKYIRFLRESRTLASPLLESDIKEIVEGNSIPGNMRKPEHFINLLKRLVLFVKHKVLPQSGTGKISSSKEERECKSPLRMRYELNYAEFTDNNSIKTATSRLGFLLYTLKVTNVEKYWPLVTVLDFLSLVATYSLRFALYFDPYPELKKPKTSRILLQMACLDPSVAFKAISGKSRNVILASGNFTPSEIYEKLLDTKFATIRSFVLDTRLEASFCPLIVTKANDNTLITAKRDLQDETVVLRNFGGLLADLVKVVPDGLVCVFSDYYNLRLVINKWNSMGVIDRLLEQKLIFIETPNISESMETFELYSEACSLGRGGILFITARGVLSETLYCSSSFAKCVVFFGIPYQYHLSFLERIKLEYLQKVKRISKAEFATFGAMRVLGAIVGRVLNSKADYMATILADKKYSLRDRIEMLPKWMQKSLQSGLVGPRIGITEDNALHMIKGLLQGASIAEEVREGINDMDIF